MTAMPARSGYRGYVSSREFGGLRIPVPVQALVLRDYAQRKKLLYKLHVNENLFPHSYMVLEGLVRTLNGFEGVLVCSMFMLPERPERRARIYERILEQGVEMHLVLEDMVIARRADIAPVEEILQITETLRHCPASVPIEVGSG
jgi:sporadic carbohydrate cluster protein (TIGR04323 family)